MKGAERVEGGGVGGRRGRRGQRRGQIYFLRTMVLDDGPLSGVWGPAIWQPSREKAKRSALAPLPVAHTLLQIGVYVRQSWSPVPLLCWHGNRHPGFLHNLRVSADVRPLSFLAHAVFTGFKKVIRH